MNMIYFETIDGTKSYLANAYFKHPLPIFESGRVYTRDELMDLGFRAKDCPSKLKCVFY